jgi:hypothetical protein
MNAFDNSSTVQITKPRRKQFASVALQPSSWRCQDFCVTYDLQRQLGSQISKKLRYRKI